MLPQEVGALGAVNPFREAGKVGKGEGCFRLCVGALDTVNLHGRAEERKGCAVDEGIECGGARQGLRTAHSLGLQTKQ